MLLDDSSIERRIGILLRKFLGILSLKRSRTRLVSGSYQYPKKGKKSNFDDISCLRGKSMRQGVAYICIVCILPRVQSPHLNSNHVLHGLFKSDTSEEIFFILKTRECDISD